MVWDGFTDTYLDCQSITPGPLTTSQQVVDEDEFVIITPGVGLKEYNFNYEKGFGLNEN